MSEQSDAHLWQGRTDDLEGELGLRWHQVIAPMSAYPLYTESSDLPQIALLGFACDAGVVRNHGRAGAQYGPHQIRKALANMPWTGQVSLWDAGDISCGEDVQGALEQAQSRFAQRLCALLAQGVFPIGLGGGHEIAYASFMGLADYYAHHTEHKRPQIGIVNLDAHFDLRLDERASSGTPFLQIANDCKERAWDFHYCCLGVSAFSNTRALFARADELNVRWRLDSQMGVEYLEDITAQLAQFIAPLDAVYLTVDLDVLPAHTAPGVSAPAAMGVPLAVVEVILAQLCSSGKLQLLDVAELNPNFDQDQQTARVAARLIAQAVSLMGSAKKITR